MSWAKYGGFHYVTKQGLAPQNVTASGNGTGFSRLGYNHMVCILNVGVTAGSGALALDIKVQDSADDSTYADYTPNVIFDNGDTSVTTAKFKQITSGNANAVMNKMDVDLSAAKKYIRFVKTVAGTSPQFLISVDCLLDQRDGVAPGADS